MTDQYAAPPSDGSAPHGGAPPAGIETVARAGSTSPDPTAVQEAADAPADQDRYAELTYSSFDSFDDGRTAGGWQVKQVRGRLSESERDSLRAQVSTHLDAGIELPRFPTPEQISGFPRRLLYGAAGPGFAGGAAWWHTAPAGVDASGRPGNVFAHVVLDRTPQLPPLFRPIDLWRSPAWLTPYGPEAVAAAELTAGLPPVGTVINTDAVIDFCFAVFDRIAVLGPLVDACAAALAGGRPVVLTVADSDRAAAWIGAVSHLTDARTARRLHFSTLERSSGLADTLRRGVHLACVPTIDADDLDQVLGRAGIDAVIIKEDEMPELGDLGAAGAAHPHVTERGDRITVTEWSVLARVVLEAESAESARTALQRLDDVSTRLVAVEPTACYPPSWPLAMAIATLGDLFAEAHPEATRVIARHSPAGLERLPELYGPAARLIAVQCGTTTADAWVELAADDQDPGDHDRGDHRTGTSVGAVLIFDTYLRRAIADPDWLVRPDGVPLPQPLPEVDHDRIAPLAEQQLDLLLGQESADPVLVARLADLLVRTGLITPRIEQQLGHLSDQWLVPHLRSDTGAQLVQRIGPLAEPTLATVVRPGLLPEPPRELGRSIPPAVLGWLYPQPPVPLGLEDLYERLRSDQPPADYWLRGERDWSLILHGGASSIGRHEIPYAVWTMLHATQLANPATAPWLQPEPDWTRCLPLCHQPLYPGDLWALVHYYEPRRSTAITAAAATLLTVPWTRSEWSSQLVRLCRLLDQRDRLDRDRRGPRDRLPEVRGWLGERTWTAGSWLKRSGTILQTVQAWLEYAEQHQFPQPRQFAWDVRAGVIAALILELASGRDERELAALTAAFGPELLRDAPLAALRLLCDTVGEGLVAGEKLWPDNRLPQPPAEAGFVRAAALAARADPAFLDGRLRTPGAAWAARFDGSTPGLSLLESAVADRLERLGAGRDDRKWFAGQVAAVLSRELSSVDNTRELERQLNGWLRDLARRGAR